MIQNKVGESFLGKTLELTNGTIGLAVTLDVGPRIISLWGKAKENLMFHDVNDVINKDSSAIYGEGKTWHIYGGHRFWVSPEEEKTYYPDNEPVKYEIIENGAVFAPEPWRVFNIQPIMKIEFTGEKTVRITTEFFNLSEESKKLCIWNLSVFKPGGTLTVPLETKDTGYLANRNLVFWSYDDLRDARFSLENDKVILKSDVKATKPFKIGLYKTEIEAKYEFNSTVFVKRVKGEDDAEYPDYVCNLETYTNCHIHEIETLSPRKEVAAGGKISHTEEWEID